MSGRVRKWDEEKLRDAAANSYSIRSVIKSLGLVPAGGNYVQVKYYLNFYKIDTRHFKGEGWSKGLRGIGKPRESLVEILVQNNSFQSFKLKKRLFKAGLKEEKCELCGWNQKSPDGRLPLELDHINGNHQDNRLENLRILSPNCHSLQSTHRGRNRAKK